MNVMVTVRGEVPNGVVRRANERINSLERYTHGPLTNARVVLTQERNPRIERGARAEGEILFAGRPLRARAQAKSMRAAVDELSDQLADQLRTYIDRLVDRRHSGG
jgi:ribosomal subunit interface protein